MNPYIGSDFDDFLAEDGIKEDVTAAALKRVLGLPTGAGHEKARRELNRDGAADENQSHHRAPPAGRRGHQCDAGHPEPRKHGAW